ncbi:MAG: hypothetical protein KGI35_12850 [Burkholderiales bacterium]|nr:hypothetical protein [Burkholderiales bacterium]MDE2396893.1 hypothetical protein [Burkholderiales bacterium]
MAALIPGGVVDAELQQAGMAAGIDMSLHRVRRMHSLDLAQRTARQMAFDWEPAA